jgi:hypothetical protein
MRGAVVVEVARLPSDTDALSRNSGEFRYKNCVPKKWKLFLNGSTPPVAGDNGGEQ